jgi:hypothetical protein
MKRILWLFLLFSISTLNAQRKELSLSDLLSFANVPNEHFNFYAHKKGFRFVSDNPAMAESIFQKKAGKERSACFITRMLKADTSCILFRTYDEAEYKILKEQVLRYGFKRIVKKAPAATDACMYQKGNLIVKTDFTDQSDSLAYNLYIEKVALPKSFEIFYAEDMLQFASHEWLVSVFGEENAKKDTVDCGEKEKAICTVLFPGTNSQTIFIWKDNQNFMDISFVIIGGVMEDEERNSEYKVIEQNKWHSRSGVFLGMPLNDLIKVNNNHINLYGWQTEYPGFVANDNKGNLDFKKIGIELECLDCREDKFYSSNGMINSASLLADKKRIYVSKLILIPSP